MTSVPLHGIKPAIQNSSCIQYCTDIASWTWQTKVIQVLPGELSLLWPCQESFFKKTHLGLTSTQLVFVLYINLEVNSLLYSRLLTLDSPWNMQLPSSPLLSSHAFPFLFHLITPSLSRPLFLAQLIPATQHTVIMSQLAPASHLWVLNDQFLQTLWFFSIKKKKKTKKIIIRTSNLKDNESRTKPPLQGEIGIFL